MPEGPEVRRYADQLSRALSCKRIVAIGARTKNARAWLAERGDELIGKKILSVHAHGKNIIGLIESDYYFYSHQMMWGRWHVLAPQEAIVADRRERARIKVKNKVAVLMSAPIFEVGEGDPFKQIRYLSDLGPNILTYGAEKFDRTEFLRRLQSRANMSRTIGAALLDQSIAAGIGNYLRAEIMFIGKINRGPKLAIFRRRKKNHSAR